MLSQTLILEKKASVMTFKKLNMIPGKLMIVCYNSENKIH